ncbi:MAG: ABC transporter ATP-binding protein [Chitinophagaceae bacterium]|nr:ABC transporter ATP-binding protein [Anaerolineae bacterium]
MTNESDNAGSPHADMRWLWQFVVGHRLKSIAAVGSGILGGITAAAEPYLIGQIIDHVRAGISLRQLLGDIFLLVLFALITLAAFYGQRTYSGDVAYSVLYDVRKTLFNNLVTLEQRFYQSYTTGDLISRMNSDLEMIWRLLALGLNRIGSAILTIVVAFFLLATVNLPLTVLVFVILTISTTFQLRAGRLLVPMFEKVQDQAGNVSGLVQDVISGIQTVKTSGKEAGAAEKFHQENLEYRRRWLYFKRRNEPVGMLPNMISETTSGFVVLFGGMMAVNGSLTVGNFVQFLIYLSLISTALLQIGTIYQRLQQTRGALVRLTPLLQPADIADEQDAKSLTKPRGEILFENVGVKMGDHWMVRDISLHIPAGSVVAFVGPTGCGKTLLMNLLARVMDPTEGRVLIDGVDARTLVLDDLRRAIAYVPQSTFLFSQPLQDNIRMGRDNITGDSIDRVVHISRVSNDLPQLPRGLHTLVGEKGVMLSGGQKQRVAIARAIIRDPAILVLDDALSSVDTQTAADILADLRQVFRSRTSLIIAHRIATVKDADLIIVMENGQIVEQGKHSELIAHNGLYARMVEREMSTEGDKEITSEEANYAQN